MISEGRELGLGLQTDKRPGTYAPLAVAAEEAGFAVVTTFNDLWFQPALPALLEIAAATRRVRVGPSCLNPFTLHPVEIAGQIAALDAVSGGRAFLGLARGAWLDSLTIDQSDAVAAIGEAAEIVRRLIGGDRSGFEGRRFSLPANAGLRYPVARSAIPLLIGAWGPRLAALAGEIADELKVGGSANPGLVPVVRERIANPAVAIVFGAVTVVDDDGDRARAAARREVAMYLDVVAELDPTASIDPELLAPLRRCLAAGDSEGAGALVPDGALELFAFAGTPAEIAEQTEALFDAGVRRVDFGAPHGIDGRRGVELLCREVVPRLGARSK